MLTYNLEQRNDEPKYYYIYKMIRRDIERGKLKKSRKRAESATAYASRDTGRNRRWTIAECSTFQLSIFPVF